MKNTQNLEDYMRHDEIVAWAKTQRRQEPKRYEVTTTNLADFGYCERKQVIDLLTAMNEQGLPSEFDGEGVQPMLNRNSGSVFLTNGEYQVAMMNGPKLEIWNSCPECGREGFNEDCWMVRDGCNGCKMEIDYEREEVEA